MNKQQLTFLFLAIATISSNVYAGWTRVGANEQGTLFYDAETIRTNNEFVTMWTLVDLHQPTPLPQKGMILSFKIQAEFDCKRERIRKLFMSMHSSRAGQGNTLDVSREPGSWGPIPPGTPAETQWKIVCPSIRPR